MPFSPSQIKDYAKALEAKGASTEEIEKFVSSAASEMKANPKYDITDLPIPFDLDSNMLFNSRKVGEEMNAGVYGRIKKLNDKEFESIGPEDSPIGAAARSGLISLPAAAAGTAAVGQANTALAPLRESPYMPIRAIGTLGPLAYGALAAMGTGALTREVAPEAIKAQLERDAAQNPKSVLAGNTAAQLPFFRPGLGLDLGTRAAAGAIGAGVEGGMQLATEGKINPNDLLISAASNAILNKETGLGSATLNLGSKLGANKAASIVSKLGNIKAKGEGNVVETNALANDIAMEPPKNAEESAQILSGLMPQRMASDAAKSLGTEIRGLDPAIQAKEIAYANQEPELPLSERAQTLEGLMPQQPASQTLLSELMKMGIGVRPKGTSAKMEPQKIEVPKSEFVGLSDDGKGGTFELWNIPEGQPNAGSTVTRDSLERLGFKVPEVSGEMVKDAQARQKAIQDKINEMFSRRSEPAPIPEPTTTEQNPVKPTETTQEGPSKDNPEYPLTIRNGKMVDAFDREVVKDPESNRYELKGFIGGKQTGAVLNPAEIVKAASERGSEVLAKANEPILQKMAEYEVSKNAPEQTKAPEQAAPQNTAEEAVALAKKYTTKAGIRQSIRQVKDESGIASPEPEAEHVASEIHSAPDEYKPLLTDLAARFPVLEKIPLGKETSTAIGWIAKGVKNKLGLLDENIRERSPRVFGALHDKIFGLNEQRLALSQRADKLGQDLRKYLSKDDWISFQEAALSGDRERAEAIISQNPNAEKLQASLDEHQAVMKELAADQKATGRDVPELDFYFHRRIADRDGLLKALGSEGENRYSDLVRQTERANGKPLDQQERDDLLNSFIQGSMRNAGKPGYLKPRVIENISKDLLKYYEPIDVATHDYVMSSTRDISNRAFFGKSKDGELIDWTGDSSIGKVLREEVESGRLDRKGFDAVSKALQAYFNNSVKYDKDIAGLAGAIRRAQTRLYLGDISTVLPQYADILTSAYNYGPGATRNYFGGKGGRIKIEDIGLHEGINQELDVLRRRNEAPEGFGPVGLAKKAMYYTGKAYDTALKQFLGRADRFNKEGMINSAFRWVSDVVKKPYSEAFRELNKKYSEQFPEKWPEILDSLRSDDFAKGKLDRNARFFLFNELMSLQPIDPAGRAQGYNEAGPLGKALYTLRSYALTQINILRRDAYNNIKSGNKEDVAKGLGNLAFYLGLVGVGGATLNYLRDKFLNRQSTPEEYAMTGLLQLIMIPRFAVMKAKEEGPLMAGLQTAIPGLSAGADFWKDSQLGLKAINGATDKSGRPLVDGFEDFLKQSRMLQYAPGIGRELYWWMGKGAQSSQKAAEAEAKGKPQKSTLDLIEEMVNPPDLKTNRRQ